MLLTNRSSIVLLRYARKVHIVDHNGELFLSSWAGPVTEAMYFFMWRTTPRYQRYSNQYFPGNRNSNISMGMLSKFGSEDHLRRERRTCRWSIHSTSSRNCVFGRLEELGLVILRTTMGISRNSTPQTQHKTEWRWLRGTSALNGSGHRVNWIVDEEKSWDYR